jgi:hypothetical protein
LNIDINMLKTSCLKGSAHYGIWSFKMMNMFKVFGNRLS